MAKAIPATDYLAKPTKPVGVGVVFGDDAFLRREVLMALRNTVLSEQDAEFSLTRFEGPDASLRDVLDELETVAMFGGGQRLVVVDQADEFVTRYRGELESYAASPRETGVLILELRSFPSNTRLYKAVAAQGCAIDAGAPKGAQLVRWLAGWAKRRHGVEIAPPAAEMLIELVGPELGLLDQELAKLALSTPADKKIGPELVRRYVGSWRAKTAWDLVDAALAGNLPNALKQLDLLLGAGEQPIGVLGQISYSLRQLAAATRLIARGEVMGRRIPLTAALEQAGVRSFVLRKAEQQLRRLGRARGQRLLGWLLEADLDLKGASPASPRLVLERLIVRLASPADALTYPSSRA